MSRSYKKNPYSTDNRSSGDNKKIANRTFRRNKKTLYQGGAYKKAYCSWNICDYRFRYDEKDVIEYYYQEINKNNAWIKKHYPTLDDYLNYCRKVYIRK